MTTTTTGCRDCGHPVIVHTPSGCDEARTGGWPNGTVCDCTEYTPDACVICNGFGCAECYR